MRKTASEIEGDMFALINSSALKQAITGTVYREGYRPLNAKSEDAVISFMTGLDDEIQTGVLTLNIYTPDIDNGSGDLVKNGARCRVLEILANGIVHGFTPGEYRFKLGGTVQTFPADEIGQHFINAKIKFQLATF